VHGDERGRARGVDAYARSPEVEFVGDAGGGEVRAVGQQRCPAADAGEHILAWQHILDEIAVEACADVDADASACVRGIDACILETVPRFLQQHALLRVDHLGLAGGDAEELRVEAVDVFQHAVGRHVVGSVGQLGRHAGGKQLFAREECDTVASGAEVAPELLDALRLRKTSGHADDRDGAIGDASRRDRRALGRWGDRERVFVDERGLAADGGIPEQFQHGDLGARFGADALLETHEHERVSAEVEKVVVDTGRGARTEHGGPRAGDGGDGAGGLLNARERAVCSGTGGDRKSVV
jgi:hypothetical protein